MMCINNVRYYYTLSRLALKHCLIAGCGWVPTSRLRAGEPGLERVTRPHTRKARSTEWGQARWTTIPWATACYDRLRVGRWVWPGLL